MGAGRGFVGRGGGCDLRSGCTSTVSCSRSCRWIDLACSPRGESSVPFPVCFCLSVSLSLCLSVSLSACLSLSLSLSLFLSVFLSLSPSVCMHILPCRISGCVSLFLCLSSPPPSSVSVCLCLPLSLSHSLSLSRARAPFLSLLTLLLLPFIPPRPDLPTPLLSFFLSFDQHDRTRVGPILWARLGYYFSAICVAFL